jgi:hypothetical protein
MAGFAAPMIFAAVILAPFGALAQTAPPAAVAAAPAAASGQIRGPVPLRADEMAGVSGGQEMTVTALTRQQLTGVTSGNSITAGSVISGDVNFSQSALSGFSGVGNFVVNTGANNTLQGAINISVVTAPGR